MNHIIPILLAILSLACGSRTALALEWTEDLASAADQARQGNRYLLLNFSGSDWCGWCIKLDQEVFSTPVFREYAATQLVPVLVDFPRNKPQSDAIKARNERLMRQLNVQGFPTLLLFSPAGEFIAQLGYQPGGPEVFIQSIRRAQARHQMRAPNAPPAPRLPAP